MSVTASPAAQIAARLDRLPASATIWHAPADLARTLLRDLRPVPDRLYRARGRQAAFVHPRRLVPSACWRSSRRPGIGTFVFALFAGLFVGTIIFRLCGRQLWPADDLYLLAAVVFRLHPDHGVPDRWIRRRSVALHGRHRHWRGTGNDRHLRVGTGSPHPARQGLRLQPVHRLLHAADAGLPGLPAGAGKAVRHRRLARSSSSSGRSAPSSSGSCAAASRNRPAGSPATAASPRPTASPPSSKRRFPPRLGRLPEPGPDLPIRGRHRQLRRNLAAALRAGGRSSCRCSTSSRPSAITVSPPGCRPC